MSLIRQNLNRLFLIGVACLFLISVSSVVWAMPSATSSEQAGATATVNTGALNVRSGPSVAYSVVTVVYQGNVVTLQGRNSSGSWVKIQFGTAVGWVNQSLLNTSASITDLPILSEAAPSAVGTVATGALNVRTGPGVTYGVITTVGFGQNVALIGRTSNNVWVKIQLANGQQGWVNSTLLTTNVSVGTLPLADSPAQPDPAVPVAPNALLSLRAGPSFSQSVVGNVFQGQRVQAIGRNSANSWVKVQVVESGLQGWILSGNVQLDIPITNLPVINDSTTQPTATPIAPTATPVNPTATPVNPTATPVNPTATPTPASGVTATVNTGALNVRSGPAVSYGVVAVLNQGTTVSVTGRNSDNSWVRVATGNISGWVLTSLTTINGDLATIPIINVDAPANSGTVNTGALNVRSGPSVEFSSVAVVTQGTTVGLVGRNADASWLQIRLSNGTVGWVNANFITTSTTLSTLPVTG